MSMFRDMSDPEKALVLLALDVQLTAIMETRVKLRERRNNQILSSQEDFEVETALLRLDQMASDIVSYKNALLSCSDDLQPPSATDLEAMRGRVQRIRDINVANNTTSAIITISTEVIGSIPKIG